MNTQLHRLTRSISLGTALAAIACGVAFSITARADYSDGEPLTKLVNYSDLNLNSEPAAPTLYGRLRLAATEVCAPFRGTSLMAKEKWRECFGQALADAVGKVDEPVLTAYYLNRKGKTEPSSRVAKER